MELTVHFFSQSPDEVLGDKVLAVTTYSEVNAESEMEGAKEFALKMGVNHLMVPSNDLDKEEFVSNPVNRCYFCKTGTFSILREIAQKNNFDFVIDGSNADDVHDYRPGMKALEELKIRSPLKEAELTKDEIRSLSKEMGLKTWDQPALACLASRIPYGSRVTSEKLKRIDIGETFLRSLGFIQVRVRDHDDIARIEIAPEEFNKLFNYELINKINEKFLEIGYLYSALDLGGYKSGNLNKKILNN